MGGCQQCSLATIREGRGLPPCRTRPGQSRGQGWQSRAKHTTSTPATSNMIKYPTHTNALGSSRISKHPIKICFVSAFRIAIPLCTSEFIVNSRRGSQIGLGEWRSFAHVAPLRPPEWCTGAPGGPCGSSHSLSGSLPPPLPDTQRAPSRLGDSADGPICLSLLYM